MQWTQKGTFLQVYSELDVWIYFLRPCICITTQGWGGRG